MILPADILSCLDALENAGFEAYVVGGCVRDACLGLTPHDYDICTAALPGQTRAVFSRCRLVLAGEKHGTVGVVTPSGVVEITTYRTEGEYRDNRHPDRVDFVTNIRQDLARRDFTVNAMAWSPRRGLADPFGGQQDLQARCLRAVGDPEKRFQEDSLRILRGVRFAVGFGLTPEPQTLAAMTAQAPLLDNLARERVFEELCRLLPLVTARDLLRFAPVLVRAIPELAPMVGYDQKTPYHIHDLYTHTALVVSHCPAELTLRWAALLHDIGKIPVMTLDETGQAHYYGHAAESARMADAILTRLRAPTALRRQAVTLIEKHMTLPEPDRKLLRRRRIQLGDPLLDALLTLQEADTLATGTDHTADLLRFSRVREMLARLRAEDACLSLKDLALDGRDLLALGYSGPAIGRELNRLLELVVEEQCPNTRQALLAALTPRPKEDVL